MQRLILGFICAVVWAGTAGAASPNDEIAAPIKQFIDNFNKGDAKAAAKTNVENGLVIIDEVAPFVWQGKDAFKAWNDDLAKHDKAQGVTDELVTLSAATRVESEGNQAYAVVPAVYTFKQKGVAMREVAQMTFALRKGDHGWRIAGWSWTGPTPQPAQ